MADELDVDAMLNRFRERARAVRQRGLPPIEGGERKRFADQARMDYMDYAMIGDATATWDGGILTLQIDLRPPEQAPPGAPGPDAPGPDAPSPGAPGPGAPGPEA